MKKLTKGFTLIELLVVIAIIGILSAIVLASLNSARTKGADAAIKGNLNGIRAQAELVYDNTVSYDTVCADPNVSAAGDAASQAYDGTKTADVCNDSATAWAMQVPLKTSGAGRYCVDSTGKTSTSTTALASNTVCP